AVRSAKGTRTVGNQISAMITPLATHIACPKERLHTIQQTMRTAKRRFAMSPATWLHELSALVPAPLAGVTTAGLATLASVAFPPINLIISNVPGPQFPLYLCGARVRSYYPLSVLTDLSGGINITCFSYDDSLNFGIIACPRRAPGSGQLIGHLREAMDELVTLAEAEFPQP
ncbi:MAG TPA: WS/DGAT domain-containing protein, partial [Thermopolyspora sp.]